LTKRAGTVKFNHQGKELSGKASIKQGNKENEIRRFKPARMNRQSPARAGPREVENTMEEGGGKYTLSLRKVMKKTESSGKTPGRKTELAIGENYKNNPNRKQQ